MNERILENKTLLVTGAASGIGRAVSLALAQQGATLLLLDRYVAGLEQVYDQIEQQGSPQAAIIPMDLARASGNEYQDVFNNIEQEFSVLDGIIHNAALLGRLTPINQMDIENWINVMQVNLNAPYLLTRVCFPLLQKAPNASVLFTTDQVARQGKAYWGAYSVSKAGMDNLMQIYADEMEVNTHIRFNSINPGAVATNLRNQAYPGENPLNISQPEQIVDAYIYMMSEQSLALNGKIIEAQNPKTWKG